MFYKIICIAGLFIGCFLKLSAQDSTLTRFQMSKLASEHYEKGLNYHYQRQFDKATIEFEKTISLDPYDYLAYYFNGLSYERNQELEKALQNYNLSISVKPDFNEALFNRALVLYKTCDYEKSIEDLEYLLTLPAGETQAIFFRGLKYGQDNDKTVFDNIISMTNKNADIYNYLGLCYYQMDLYEKSSLNFFKAININPEDDNVLANAGLNFLVQGNIDSARICFERSLSINPNNSVAALNLSLCVSDSSAEQIRQLDQLIKKNEDFPMAYAQRAYQFYLAGNYEASIKDYNSAIRLDPNNSEYLLERGMLYEKIYQVDKAISDFKSALRYDINNFQIWYNLGNAYFHLEDYSLSIEYYSEAIQINPQIPELYYNRSIAFYKLKELEKACQDMEKAHILGKQNAEDFILRYCQ